MTYSEFLDWLSYLNEEEDESWKRFTKMDYYLARIALAVTQGNVKNPNSLKLRDFMPKPDGAKSKKMNPTSILHGFLGYFANRRIKVDKVNKNGDSSK